VRTLLQSSALLALLLVASVNADDARANQQELDAACEAARQEKLAPLREKYIEECVEEQGKDRDYCTRFYRDYGERSGVRPAFFYDLPECEEAWAFKKNNR
jgi:hypothetical protein